jgi:hypothetical protein
VRVDALAGRRPLLLCIIEDRMLKLSLQFPPLLTISLLVSDRSKVETLKATKEWKSTATRQDLEDEITRNLIEQITTPSYNLCHITHTKFNIMHQIIDFDLDSVQVKAEA